MLARRQNPLERSGVMAFGGPAESYQIAFGYQLVNFIMEVGEGSMVAGSKRLYVFEAVKRLGAMGSVVNQLRGAKLVQDRQITPANFLKVAFDQAFIL
jgi:hypothetical protein